MLAGFGKRLRRHAFRLLDDYRIGRSRRLEELLRRADWPGLAALPPDGVSWRDRWKDREIIDFARRMSRRPRSARKPVALCEHHLFGRPQEFHHFLGAVVIPFLQLVSMDGALASDVVIFPDCGYLNKIIVELADRLGLSVDFYPIFIADAIADDPELRVLHLPPYDASSMFGYFLTAEQLAAVRALAFQFADLDGAQDATVQANENRVLLIERAPPVDYYLSERHRNPVSLEGHSGSARRSIANADELREAISQRFDVTVAHLEKMSFRDQIRAFHGASMIVAQHGAGLNGVLWARPGGGVVEIIPTNKLRNEFAIFGNLASAAGLRHCRVVQSDPHAAVDVDLVLAALESVRPGIRALPAAHGRAA